MAEADPFTDFSEPLSPALQAVAEAALAFMRDPARFLISVHERQEISGARGRRTVKLHLLPQDKDDLPRYVLLVTPRKGRLLDVSVKENKGTYLLGHQEHVWLSQLLIYYRTSSILDAVTGSAEQINALATALFPMMLELQRIPTLDQQSSKEILDTLFDRSSRSLKIIGELSLAVKNNAPIAGLYELMNMLSERYIVAVKTNRDEVEYQYHEFVQEGQVGSGSSTDDGKLPSILEGPILKQLVVGAHGIAQRTFQTHPRNWLIHAPLAKKTNHHVLEVTAPDGSLVVGHELFVAAKNASTNANELSFSTPKRPVRWSRDTHRGRSAHSFMTDGKEVGRDQALYVWVKIDELPGRSTMGAMLGFWLLFVAFLLFGVLNIATLGTVPGDVPAMLVGLIALSIASVESLVFRGQTADAIPLASRAAPFGIVIATLTFITWYLSASRLLLISSDWWRVGVACAAAITLGLILWILYGAAHFFQERHSFISRRYGRILNDNKTREDNMYLTYSDRDR